MYKHYSTNKFLYHFTKINTAINHILPSRNLRFSPFTKTNDPYETKQWSITIKNSLEEIENINYEYKKSTIELIMDFNQNREEYVNGIKKRIKLLCFSEDEKSYNFQSKDSSFGFKRGWGYPRMWAQYGDDHKGICLLFDRKSLQKEIRNKFSDDFDIFNGNINYTDNLIDTELNEISFSEVKDLGIKESIVKRLTENINSFFFKKALDWQTEREFRYVLVSKKNFEEEFVFVPISNSLKVVIVGSEIKLNDEQKIEKLVQALGIRLYKLDWDFSTPMIHNGPYQSWGNNIVNPFQ